MFGQQLPGVEPSALHQELIRCAARLSARPQVRRIFYISDLPVPAPLLDRAAAEKLVHVVSSPSQRDAIDHRGGNALLVPAFEMARQEKLKLALVGATARGYVQPRDEVLGLVGPRPEAHPDTLLAVEIDRTPVEVTAFGEIGSGRVSPSVFDAIVELAVELGVEGWEGHALGTMFVIGDVERVMRGSRQLTLNPFRGYAESERCLVNPAVREAIRSFATLDGAFVVREDGVVMAAARYIEIRPRGDVQVPLGLGARHMAAAMVTAATEAIAVVVSQSTGKVRVLRRGTTVLELTPSHRRT